MKKYLFSILSRLQGWLRSHPLLGARSAGELRNEMRRLGGKGILDLQTMNMLEGVFNLARLRASEIMIPRARMKVISIDATREEVLQQIEEHGHSRYPVIDGDRGEVQGILLTKHVLTLIGENPHSGLDIREMMLPPYMLPETRRLTDLLRDFQRHRLHMGIVVNEFGEASGLITIEDVLEEIVGEIADEHDPQGTQSRHISSVGEGHYELEASLLLEDFCKHFGVPILEQGIRTIGGLVARHSDHLLQVGEQVQVGSFLFTVTRVSGRRIRQPGCNHAQGPY